MFPITMDLGFKVFPFYEGLYFAIAIAVGLIWSRRRVQAAQGNVDLFDRAIVWVLVGAIVGARLFHFAFWDWNRLASDPLVFFRVWEGGLTIVGGLVGGIGMGAFLFIREKADFWIHFALISPALLLAQAVGRVGCFLNGDAWGIPTNLPWGVSLPKYATKVPAFVPDTSTPSMAWDWAYRHGFIGADAMVTVPLHPTQLYESFADLLLMVFVLLVFRGVKAGKQNPARIFWLHVGGYSLIRFLVEFVHGDHEFTDLWGMTSLQIELAILAAVSAVVFLVLKPRPIAAPVAKGKKGR